jgi:DNA polymerase
MLVGEAPGKEEAATGRPFVGPAGKVLGALLDRLAIPRRDIWITNTYKIRPVSEGSRGEVNRAPRSGEIKQHRWILDREIQIIRPKVIVALGAVAASALIGQNFRVKENRGRWFPGPDGSRVMATYHPSYLLRLRGPDYEAARDEMLADLSKAWGEAKGA